MTDRSIAAYSLPERVAAYDAAMDLMHPNRPKMIDVALEILPSEGRPTREISRGTRAIGRS